MPPTTNPLSEQREVNSFRFQWMLHEYFKKKRKGVKAMDFGTENWMEVRKEMQKGLLGKNFCQKKNQFSNAQISRIFKAIRLFFAYFGTGIHFSLEKCRWNDNFSHYKRLTRGVKLRFHLILRH